MFLTCLLLMISHIRMIKGIGPRVAIVFFVAFICKECVGSEEPLFQLTVSASVDGPAVKALRGFGKDLNKIITDVVAPSAAPSLVSILTTDVSLAPTVTDIPVAASARAGTSGSTAPTVSVIPNPPPRATPTAAKARDGTSGSLAPTSSPKTLAKPAVILSSAPTTSDIPTASASGRYSSPASVMVSVTDTPTAIPSSAVQIQATSLPTTSPSSYVESKKYALAASNDQKNVSVSVTLVAPTPLPLF